MATEASALLEKGKDIVLIVIYPTTIEAVISNLYRCKTNKQYQEKLVETQQM